MGAAANGTETGGESIATDPISPVTIQAFEGLLTEVLDFINSKKEPTDAEYTKWGKSLLDVVKKGADDQAAGGGGAAAPPAAEAATPAPAAAAAAAARRRRRFRRRKR